MFVPDTQAYQRLQIQQQMLQAQRNVSGPIRQQEQQVSFHFNLEFSPLLFILSFNCLMWNEAKDEPKIILINPGQCLTQLLDVTFNTIDGK